jgi:predicted amidohydrolase YtcJ
MLKNVFIFICANLLLSCSPAKQQVDLIVHHALIYTVDSAQSTCEAMAIHNGNIVATGSNEEILRDYSAGDTLHANGHCLLPGFIDAHCHFTGYATDLWKCDLVGTNSFEDVLTRLKAYAPTASMQWIYGRGWDQNDWAVKNYPDNSELNRLFPDRPVFLKRIDGHAALVNDKALALAGVTANTKVSGGKVEVKNGRATGLLLDNAMDLVDQKVPALSDSLTLKYFYEAEQTCYALGLTGVHDCGISERTLNLLDKAQRSGFLGMKVSALLSDDSTIYAKWIQKGIYKTPLLHVFGFKIYADGALGSRGACLGEDYADQPGWKGFLLTDYKRMQKIAALLAPTPFQMCTHAIGDSANRSMLGIYAEVLKGKNNKRWRIEHAQVVNQNDFKAFGDNSIIPSIQPTHATSDMYWAGKRLGEKRMVGAYAYLDLLQAAGLVSLGTDFPVEDISPLKTFYAAVARKDLKGYPEKGFQKENALSRAQTLKGMTFWAAYSAFEEKEKGSLEKGKAADFILLDRDILLCAEEEIPSALVLRTYLNGKVVYSR